MPRKRRICIEGATYHVMSRCIEKKALMKPDKMKDIMIAVLRMALEKYNFELNQYTIMDNHFHFVIKTKKDGENISRIMQFIKSQYAQRYNWLMHRTGPFWNERFSDHIVEQKTEPGEYHDVLAPYIGLNPVRSGYVKDPRDYRYSSYRCFIDPHYVPPVKITLSEYYMKYGDTFEERAKVFLEKEERYRKRILPESLFK